MHESHYNLVMKVDTDAFLLFNSLSGSADLVDSAVVKVLRGQLINDRVEKYLISRGYLTSKTIIEEKSEMKRFFTEVCQTLFKNKEYGFVITYKCNLACPYCFEASVKEGIVGKRTTVIDDRRIEKAFEVIDFFDDLGDNKKISIKLYGGEPLMPENRRAVEYIIKNAITRDRKIAVITNGIYLNEYIDYLAKYKDRIDFVQVSLDGPKNEHDKRRVSISGNGTFDRIIHNIELVLLKGIKTSIRILVDSENEHTIPELIKFLKYHNWPNQDKLSCFFASTSAPNSNTLHNYSKVAIWKKICQYYEKGLLNEIFSEPIVYPFKDLFINKVWSPRFFACNAHTGLMIFDPYGMIYPCWKAVGQSELSIGRFYPSFKLNKASKRWKSRSVFMLKKCAGCEFSAICGGGCAYSAYVKHGTILEGSCEEMEVIKNVYLPFAYQRYLKKS